MITVDADATDHVGLTVAAPLTLSDLTTAGTALRALEGSTALRRVLVEVRSIGLPEPRAIWEDVKLIPIIGSIHRVALLTDLHWYARLSELAGAVWPGLTIKHFDPDDRAAALAWLAAGTDSG